MASEADRVAVPTVSGAVLEVSRASLEKAEQDLRDLLLAHGSMTIRTLGQKYSAAHGVNFAKAVGLTLACYLHSKHGGAFVVETGCAPDCKGKVVPFKDLVSLKPEPAPTPRTELRASKQTLMSALATVTQAMQSLGVEETPMVKNTFLEFQPKRVTRPKRKTCGAAFLNVPEEKDAEECDASPHAFPQEYDLPAACASRFECASPVACASPVSCASPVACVTPVVSAPFAPTPTNFAFPAAPMPFVMDPQQLLAMNMQLAQGLMAAQQQLAMLNAQVQQQSQQIAHIKR